MRLIFPKVKNLHQVTGGIFLLWIIGFMWHEIIIPSYSAKRCNWDHVDTKNPVTNVLLIADPQLIDNHTYPGRNPWLLKVSQHTVDIYLKKNYKSLVNHLHPDYIFFLGDYLDNGRSSSDEYFYRQFSRFNNIFPSEKFGYEQGKNFFINLPGNHDLGIGDTVKLPARTRFAKTFGQLNTIYTIDNVDIIQLDSLSYLSNNETINKDVNFFLEANFGEGMFKTGPRILLSHVPLYRNPDVDTCGPLRESDKFLLTKGYQYQLVIDEARTNNLLDRINPDLVFSGDDHDYCDTTHNGRTREITVKSISMAMGIWHPAIQLLSFANDNESLNYNTKLCYLPTPYYNIGTYVVLAVLSGVILLWCNYKFHSKRFNYTVLPLQNINSKKISDFLYEQDNDQDNQTTSSTSNYLPNYTFTSSSSSSPPSSSSSFFVKSVLQPLLSQLKKVISLIRRLQLPQFFKQALIIGTLVVCIYSLFCLTI